MPYNSYSFKTVEKDNRYSLLDLLDTKTHSMNKWKCLEYNSKWYLYLPLVYKQSKYTRLDHNADI
jgi:hypothetical protein